jgi:uncharacterized lipoprotein YbaY
MRQALGRIARATVGFACLLWFEAGVAGAGEAVLSGTVAYRERIALPSGAVVDIKLLDVSRMDVAAEVMAETAIRPEHQVPIPFELVDHLLQAGPVRRRHGRGERQAGRAG